MRMQQGDEKSCDIWYHHSDMLFKMTFAFAGHFIVHIFTDDTQMINLVVKLLIVDIFLELGRVTNLVYGQALKKRKETLFPVILGAIFMYFVCSWRNLFFWNTHGLLAVGSLILLWQVTNVRELWEWYLDGRGKWKSKGLIEV